MLQLLLSTRQDLPSFLHFCWLLITFKRLSNSLRQNGSGVESTCLSTLSKDPLSSLATVNSATTACCALRGPVKQQKPNHSTSIIYRLKQLETEGMVRYDHLNSGIGERRKTCQFMSSLRRLINFITGLWCPRLNRLVSPDSKIIPAKENVRKLRQIDEQL